MNLWLGQRRTPDQTEPNLWMSLENCCRSLRVRLSAPRFSTAPATAPAFIARLETGSDVTPALMSAVAPAGVRTSSELDFTLIYLTYYLESGLFM